MASNSTFDITLMDGFGTLAEAQPIMTWKNVAIGASLIAIDIIISSLMRVQVAGSLIVAGIRCIVQLSLMGFILDRAFQTNSPIASLGLGLAMLILASNEATFMRAKSRYQGLFLSSFVALMASVLPISLIGSSLAIPHHPYWAPKNYIPILGMISGNAIGGMALAHNYILKELSDNKDKTEMLIVYGASRFEAVLPLAREALKLALLPTINQMSVIGLISIPGMMTGALLGGASVDQAAKMQMTIMFLIASCSIIAVSVSMTFTLARLVDAHGRIRLERIELKPNWFRRILNSGVKLLKGMRKGK